MDERPNIRSFTERVLVLSDYAAPLHVVALDSHPSADGPFEGTLSNMFVVPDRRIRSYQWWVEVGGNMLGRLSSGEFADWLGENQILHTAQLEATRLEFTHKLLRLSADASLFAYVAVRNIIFLASEGPLLFSPYDVLTSTGIANRSIRQFLYDRVVMGSNTTQEEFLLWLRMTELVLQPVSFEFKRQFQGLLDYDIPYGLSPKAKIETVEQVLSHVQKIALLPLLYGANEANIAINTHNWGVAVQAAATSGATAIVLFSAAAISAYVYRWSQQQRSRPKRDQQSG